MPESYFKFCFQRSLPPLEARVQLEVGHYLTISQFRFLSGRRERRTDNFVHRRDSRIHDKKRNFKSRDRVCKRSERCQCACWQICRHFWRESVVRKEKELSRTSSVLAAWKRRKYSQSRNVFGRSNSGGILEKRRQNFSASGLILKCHIPQIIMFSSTVFLLHTIHHNYISTIKKIFLSQ